MGNIRGTSILPRVRFIQERHGAEWTRILDAVPEASRKLLAGIVLPHVWYPFSVFLDLNIAAEAVLGQGDSALVREMARYAAKDNLSTFFKFFIRFGSPETVFTKAAAMWSLTHDSGRAEIVMTGSNTVTFVIHDFATPHRVHCEALIGWMERCLELTGAKQVNARESICATGGGTQCRFDGTWR